LRKQTLQLRSFETKEQWRKKKEMEENDTERKRMAMAIRRMRNLDTETDACIPVAWLHPLQTNPSND